MIVYKSEGQYIEDRSVVKTDDGFYMVAYDMRMCTFILYPLFGHHFPRLHVPILDEIEWEYMGHWTDCHEQINIQGGFVEYFQHIDKSYS